VTEGIALTGIPGRDAQMEVLNVVSGKEKVPLDGDGAVGNCFFLTNVPPAVECRFDYDFLRVYEQALLSAKMLFWWRSKRLVFLSCIVLCNAELFLRSAGALINHQVEGRV